MPPPLVYLIPENYFGPIFVFFDQKDGKELMADPLGQAVAVPENGLIKLRAKAEDVMGKNSDTHRAEYWVAVGKDGARRVLGVFGTQTWKDENGQWWLPYMDEKMQLSRFYYDPEKNVGADFIPDALKNRPAVFARQACGHQAFSPRAAEFRSGKISGKEAGVPACGKFLIATPAQRYAFPDWMWDDLRFTYTSIEQLEADLNKVLERKRAHYGLGNTAR